MKKYYFICYEGLSVHSYEYQKWNDVIDVSPMEFIKDVAKIELEGSRNYKEFVITFVMEISKEDFDKYDGHF